MDGSRNKNEKLGKWKKEQGPSLQSRLRKGSLMGFDAICENAFDKVRAEEDKKDSTFSESRAHKS